MVIENKIPKTETVCELKDEYKVPSFEEFMKTYEADENLNYDDLTFSDISDKGKGYGPCYYVNKNCTCYVNQNPKWIQLYIACPGNGCKNRETYSWVHHNCDKPIYISTDLDLKCISCNSPSHMLN